MVPPVSAMLLAQGQKQGNTQMSTQLRIHTVTYDHTLFHMHTNIHTHTLCQYWTMHASCLLALLIHPYMFTLLSHVIITIVVDISVCVSVCVKVRESEGDIVRCVCVACYLSGGSGERKQLQGKFWGKWLLNPNIQVGMYINTNTPSTLCIYKCGWVWVCAYVCLFLHM